MSKKTTTALLELVTEARELSTWFEKSQRLARAQSGDNGSANGLSGAQGDILERIGQLAPATVPAVARSLGVSRQHVQVQVTALQQAGLIQALDNPAHKRSPLWRATEAGVWALRDRNEQHASTCPDDLPIKRKAIKQLAAQLNALNTALRDESQTQINGELVEELKPKRKQKTKQA